MNKEKDLIVTLDNNKKYVYLSGLDDYKDFIIGEIENDEITAVSDTNLFGQLIIEFNKAISQ